MIELAFIYKRLARRGTCMPADIERAFPESAARRVFRDAQYEPGIGRSGTGGRLMLVSNGPLPLWASIEHLLLDLDVSPEPKNTGLFEDELPVAFAPVADPPPQARANVFGLIAAVLLDKSRPGLAIELLDGTQIGVSPRGLQKTGPHWYLLTSEKPLAIGGISKLKVTCHV